MDDKERSTTWWLEALRRIGRSSAVVAALSSGACGSAHAPMVTDGGSDGGLSDAGSMLCDESGQWDPFEGFSPANGADYVAVVTWGLVPGGPPDPFPTILGEWGDRGCPSAPNPTACGQELQDLLTSMDPSRLGTWVIYTDAMGVHEADATDPDAVREVLGDVRTEQQALFRAWMTGYTVDCTWSEVRSVPGGFEVVVRLVEGERCGGDEFHYRVTLLVAPDGTLTEQSRERIAAYRDDGCAIGRFPQELLDGEGSGRLDATSDPLGAWFGEVARLESAAVGAFEELARELVHHGAPESLVEWARRSAREEVHHATLTASLARRFGGEPAPAHLGAMRIRSLEELALDNALEGLVRETYGAAVAHHQAQRAADESVRAVMEVVAEDESRHAAFSWALHGWLMERLEEPSRRRVRQALRRAVERFEASAARPIHPRLQREAGMPGPAAARRILSALRREAWSMAAS